MDKKATGSYYTPDYLADFISNRVLSYFQNRKWLSVLEPSVGDGAFISSLIKYGSKISIQLSAVDINGSELREASNKWAKKNSTFVHSDFLKFKPSKKFSVIIGNPPYINKSKLLKGQVDKSKKIHKNNGLSESSVKNIWTTFVVKSASLLTKDGVLAFVLPSELLQVKFAEEIREYLKKTFQRIEIFTFDDLMFECKGQDTVILVAYKKSDVKGEYFTNIESKEMLEKNDFTLKENTVLVKSNIKWTHHFLSSDELSFLNSIQGELKTVRHYSSSKPGVVTASNKFFIVNSEVEKKYNLSKYTKPIIQKGLYVNGSVVFDEEDFNSLEKADFPTRLLHLDNSVGMSHKLRQYLELGENLDIHLRYKCKKRDNWYEIPNVTKKPDGFFFKRSHLYPKLLKNNSGALVTDSAYQVKMNNGYDLNSFIYSFYNTFTLIFSEMEGRYYGGGVLELTPNEFKKLPIPYQRIDDAEFDRFTFDFENKKNIEQVLANNDYQILNSSIGLTHENLKVLKGIRKKLIKKRLRK